MARRFGGKYSPDGKPAGAQERRSQAGPQVAGSGARVKLLYVPAIILAATSLNAGPVTLVIALVGAAVLTLAAWLLQDWVPDKRFAFSGMTRPGLSLSA